MTDDLSAIADEMTALLPKFRDGGNISGMILPTEDEAAFKRLAIEAKISTSMRRSVAPMISR